MYSIFTPAKIVTLWMQVKKTKQKKTQLYKMLTYLLHSSYPEEGGRLRSDKSTGI